MDVWQTLVAQLLTLLFGSGGTAVIFTYLSNRRQQRAKERLDDAQYINDRYREQLKLKDDELAAVKLSHAIETKQIRDNHKDEFDRLRKIISDMETELERQRDRISAVLIERTNLRAKLAAKAGQDEQ